MSDLREALKPCPCPKHPFGCYGHPNLCGCEKAKVEAATALEAKDKEIEALRADFAKLSDMAKESERLRSGALEVAEQWQARAETAERELDVLSSSHRDLAERLADMGREREEARAALKPFAEAADDLADTHKDHMDIWEAPAAGSITAGNLRTARAITGGGLGDDDRFRYCRRSNMARSSCLRLRVCAHPYNCRAMRAFRNDSGADMTDHARAIEAGARAAARIIDERPFEEDYPVGSIGAFNAQGRREKAEAKAKAVIKAAIASGELVPASAVATERERCAKVADGFIEIVDRQARPLRHKIMMEKLVWDITAAIRALSPAPASGEFVVVPGPSNAVADIAAERQRQISKETWTLGHDDRHDRGELARAAICYADPLNEGRESPPVKWPWADHWWKPKDRRRDLVRAGALIVAEIERLDRAMLHAATKDGERA